MPRLTLDPISEDDRNRPLDVNMDVGNAPVAIAQISFPQPPLETLTSGSISTEGDVIAARRHANRQIPVTFAVQEPDGEPATTNLVTNPSAERDLTDWYVHTTLGVGQYTFARDDAWSSDGDWSILCEATAVADMDFMGGLAGNFAVTAGQTYTASFRINVEDAPANGPGIWSELFFFDAGNVQLAQNNSPEISTPAAYATGERWTTVTATAPPGATQAQIVAVGRTGTGAPGGAGDHIKFWIDSVQLEVAASRSAFVSGDHPGCSWSGTAHASASVRPAAGGLRFRAILADLQRKAAKFGQQGGTLRWINDDGTTFTFDVLAADGYEPALEHAYFLGSATTVPVTFTCAPYARGEAVTWTTIGSATVSHVSTYVFSAPPGDVAALGELVITDASAADVQHAAWWGIEADTRTVGLGGLDLEAEAQTILAGTSSGGVVQWTPSAATTAALISVIGQHVGRAYRVLCRAKINSGSAGATLTFGWSPVFGNAEIASNPAGGFHAVGQYEYVDLGVIRPRTEVNGYWGGLLYGTTPDALTSIYIHRFVLVPLDGGSGQIRSTAAFDHATVTSSGVTVKASGTFDYEPTSYQGDRLLIAPSRGETRTHRLLVAVSRGSRLGAGANWSDSHTDNATVDIFEITPRYLTIQ